MTRPTAATLSSEYRLSMNVSAAPNVMTSSVSMKMGSAKVASSLVSFPYLIFYRRKNSATPVMLTSTPITSLNLMRCLSNTAAGISISTGVSAISVDAIPASV